MKAHISQTGTLHITPENDTEAYALAQWHHEHHRANPEYNPIHNARPGGYPESAIVIRPYEPKSKAATVLDGLTPGQRKRLRRLREDFEARVF